MQAPVTVSIAQCDAIVGALGRNLEAHLDAIRRARAQKAGLVVFPELSLTGYHLRDLTAEVALRADDERLQPVLDASRDIDIVLGWIEESPEHQLFNAAGYFSGGVLRHRHRKVYPANYGMFEENRYWAAGDQVAAFDTAFGRAGLLICEDMWHPSTSYLLYADRADVIITLSASPARGIRSAPRGAGAAGSARSTGDAAGTAAGTPSMPGSSRTWEALLRQQSTSFNVYSVYVNRCGVEDGTTFAGGSRVIDPCGEEVLALSLDAAQEVVVLDPAVLRRRRAEVPLLRDERLDVTLGNLERIARDRFVY